jgi:hypothetical protein
MKKEKTDGTFIPGLRLSELFYWEAVRPLLERHFSGLAHSTALIGSGSEVLGFDDEMATDHHWGPRLLLFLRDGDHRLYADEIHAALANNLPYEFRGYPTNFSAPDPDDDNTQLLEAIDSGPVNHRVVLYTLRGFFAEHLGFDTDLPLQPADWLTFPEQRLLTATAGAVYHDDIGLEKSRSRFAYYPHDVWLYLLAAGWTRIGQEEHLMGRAGIAGDELGSAIIASRLVRDIMRLCFLMEKSYAPYAKWFGSAFKRLSCADALLPALKQVLWAEKWQERDHYLAEAYVQIASMHNGLNLTEPLPEQPVSFFGRPFQSIAKSGFAGVLRRQIRDPEVKRIAERPPIGSIDQFSDSTDLLSNPTWRPVLKQLYE